MIGRLKSGCRFGHQSAASIRPASRVRMFCGKWRLSIMRIWIANYTVDSVLMCSIVSQTLQGAVAHRQHR